MRKQLIKRYFITGLLIWIPLAITAWVLSLIVSVADRSLRFLPESVHPHTLIGVDIPGIGIVVTLLVITLVSASAVGFVYKITAEPIARAKAAKITAAINRTVEIR